MTAVLFTWSNTFIFINQLDQQVPKISSELRKNFVKATCEEIIGFKTDGMIFLERISSGQNKNIDFNWDFYNADGSTAEMCGNAARCAALYFHAKINKKNNITFNTVAGAIAAEVLDSEIGIVKVRMPKIINIKDKQEIYANGKKMIGFYVNTGVPHFVIQQEPNLSLARALRKASEFGKAGANITFVDFNVDEQDKCFIQAVTYERGVEDFTLACGTGAVAAAKFHINTFPDLLQQTVEMPGGLLKVEWENETPYLTGTAEFQFDLNLYEEPK